MDNFIKYMPYEGIKVFWNEDKTDLRISLPWLTLDLEINPKEKNWVIEAVDNLYGFPTHPSVQWFLGQLRDYKIGYYMPRSNTQVLISPTEYYEVALDSPSTLFALLVPDSTFRADELVSKHWAWDLEDILGRSKILGAPYYDPLSAGSLLIGKHLEIDSQTKQERLDLPYLLDELRQKDEDSFFAIARRLIRQTHYVTSHFEKYSSFALENFREADKEIQAFIQEEKGHDRLMSSSLEALGCESPEEIDVFPEIIALMNLLKISACWFPLSFVCLISFFEGVSYGDSDPISDVLLKSSRPKSGIGYKVHFNINKDGHHADVAFSLLKKIPAQSIKMIEFAARSLELAAKLGSMVDIVLINDVQEKLR